MFQRISKGLLFLTVMILFCGCGGSDKKEEESEYSLYYINKEGTKIVTEAYEPETSTTEEMVAEFIKALKKDPEEVGIKKALPEEVIVVSQRMEEKVLYISFDSTYAMMDRVEEILCRAALVKTFTQIPGVECISIYINDQPLRNSNDQPVGVLTADNFIEDISRDLQSRHSQELTLYFVNKTGDKLVEETRKVSYDSSTPLEKAIIEELIKGPQKEGSYPTLSEDTELISASVVDNICYVNFNEAFLKTSIEGMEKIPVYSVVNTLSEVPGISKVQIVVNGKAEKEFLNKTYERNLDIIEKSEVLTEEEK